MSGIEDTLEIHLRAEKIVYEKEYRFDDKRRYRFDFAIVDKKIGIEVDGGIWTKSGHTTGKGIQRDRDKDELAILNNWTVYRCTKEMVNTGRAIDTIKKLIKLKGVSNDKN